MNIAESFTISSLTCIYKIDSDLPCHANLRKMSKQTSLWKLKVNFLKYSVYIKIELFVTRLHVLLAPMRFTDKVLLRWCQQISQAALRSCLFSPLREAEAGIGYPGVRRPTLKHPAVFPCQIHQLPAKPNMGEIWTCHTIGRPVYVCSRGILSDRIRGERDKENRQKTHGGRQITLIVLKG